MNFSYLAIFFSPPFLIFRSQFHVQLLWRIFFFFPSDLQFLIHIQTFSILYFIFPRYFSPGRAFVTHDLFLFPIIFHFPFSLPRPSPTHTGSSTALKMEAIGMEAKGGGKTLFVPKNHPSCTASQGSESVAGVAGCFLDVKVSVDLRFWWYHIISRDRFKGCVVLAKRLNYCLHLCLALRVSVVTGAVLAAGLASCCNALIGLVLAPALSSLRKSSVCHSSLLVCHTSHPENWVPVLFTRDLSLGFCKLSIDLSVNKW